VTGEPMVRRRPPRRVCIRRKERKLRMKLYPVHPSMQRPSATQPGHDGRLVHFHEPGPCRHRRRSGRTNGKGYMAELWRTIRKHLKAHKPPRTTGAMKRKTWKLAGHHARA
jgi:hypothetical protein